MKRTIPAIVLAGFLALQAAAFPHLNGKMLQDLVKRDSGAKNCPFAHQNTQKKKKRQVGFDPAAQHVSTTGEHAWVAPNFAAGDKRGPCPGLNALANHGYLPHNGLAPATTIPLMQSKNDAQLTRHSGNNDLLQLDLFQQYYDALLDDTPAPQQYSALFPFRQSRFNSSIENNPYFFFPQFAGVLVAPAGYAFPPAMMSNKSAQYPEGYLDKETFKSFFAVSGEPGSFTYQQGHERIPDNWYKRAVGDEYSIPDFLLDVLQFARQDPRLLSVGGNTGTPNSFTGIDPAALTRGVYNGATLAEGNNLQCFTFQLIQAEAPGLLTGVYENVTEATRPLVENIEGNLRGLGCPQLVGVDESLYEQYPGYGRAKGP
ncbi:MAG: hypothetical protein Q9225_007677 [Loekoesia sp. 1 TL-2023]